MDFMKYLLANPIDPSIVVTNVDEYVLKAIHKNETSPIPRVVEKYNVHNPFDIHLDKLDNVTKVINTKSLLNDILLDLSKDVSFYHYLGKLDFYSLQKIFVEGNSYVVQDYLQRYVPDIKRIKLVSFVPCSGICIDNCVAHFQFSKLDLLVKKLSFIDMMFNPDINKMKLSIKEARVSPTPLSEAYIKSVPLVSSNLDVKIVSGGAGSGKTEAAWNFIKNRTGINFVSCSTNLDVLKFSKRYSVPVLTMVGSNRLLDSSGVFYQFRDDLDYKRMIELRLILMEKQISSDLRRNYLKELNCLVLRFANFMLSLNVPFVGTISAVSKFKRFFFKKDTLESLVIDECTLYREMDIYLIISIKTKLLYLTGDMHQQVAVDLLDKQIMLNDSDYSYKPSLMHWFADQGIPVDYRRESHRFSPALTEKIYDQLYSLPIKWLPSYVIKVPDLPIDIVDSDINYTSSIDVQLMTKRFARHHFHSNWNNFEKIIIDLKPEVVLTPYSESMDLLYYFKKKNILDFNNFTVRTFQGNEANRLVLDFLIFSPFVDDRMVRVAVTRFTGDQCSFFFCFI